jgi:hypothetical protein
MSRTFMAAGAAALLAGLAATTAMAAGDLATKAQKLPMLEIGLGEAGYGMSQQLYELESGKAYKLKIKATGSHDCKLRGAEFFASIYVRQIEAGEVEILNPTFAGFGFDDPSELEMYFVPVRTGAFKVGCTGLEDKGMTVEFNVK